MISTFGSFSTAKLGIRSSQQGLQITGNNITNINTNGYTRQRINQVSLYHGTADRYSVSTDVRMGFGSLVTSVSQIRDPFLDIRYRNEAANVGFYDQKLASLEELKNVLDEVSKDGVHTAFEEIRTQLQNLANNPSDKANDTLVRSACQKLVSLLNKYAADLKGQKQDVVEGFTQNVDATNDILTQIRDLNVEIRKSQIHGDPALEMIDNRNMLIDKLAEMTKIKVTYTQEKVGEGIFVDRLTIEMDSPNQDPANRPILVDGSFANKLEIQPLDNNGKPDMESENYEIHLGGLTNKNGDTPIIAEIRNQMDTLNNLTGSIQSINKQLAGINQQMQDWNTAIREHDWNEDSFGERRDETLKGLKDAVNQARQNAQANPGDEQAQQALKAAQDKLNAFNKLDKQKRQLDSKQEQLQKQFDSNFKSLESQLGQLDPNLRLNQSKNDDGTFTITMSGGTLEGNVTLIDGNNPNTRLKFGITVTENGIDLKLGEQTFASKPQEDLDQAAHKNPLLQNQFYGVLSANLEHLNEKGEFGTPPSSIRGIGYYQRSLDVLAQTVANTMNTLNHNPNDPDKNTTLFDAGDPANPNKPITAANIAISQGWLDGTVSITTSIDSSAGTGDNSNIHNMIANLNKDQQFYIVDKDGYRLTQDGQRMNENNQIVDDEGNPLDPEQLGEPVEFFKGSFEGMFTNMNAVLGADMSSTATLLNNYSIAATERAVARDNVSTVDLNEEGISLVQYQKSFTAACRVMTTLDEMLESLLNVKR